ncbi:MAG: geranylgeranylglycerol-phosphate geranylgeranyltransferase [Candidatus Zixiibacteriota bacterium]
MKRILSYFKLIRLPNSLIASISVLVGALVSGDIECCWEKVLFASLSGLLISSGGNSINDFFDLEIDRINKPYRPLPRGEIAPRSALRLSIYLFVFGIVLSFWVRFLSILLALLACALLIAYSSALKKRFLWGNVVVSLVSSLAFVYGGTATSDLRLSLIPAALALLFHLGREILKDVEDVEGDAASGACTLPIKLGVGPSLGICTSVFSFLVMLSVLPYVLHVLSLPYLLLVVPGVDVVLVYVVWSMWKDPSKSNLHRLANLLKVDMLVGMAAVLLGRV